MLHYKLLVSWVIASLFAIAPPADILGHPQTQEEAWARYSETAEAIVQVTYDPSEEPISMSPYARAESAALMTAIVGTESGLNPDVISGKKRGDHGRSWCEVQMNIGKGKTIEGWTGPELIEDMTKCIRAGYHAAKRSIGACRGLSDQFQLSAYTRGSCIEGDVASKKKQNVKWSVMSKGFKNKIPKDAELDLYVMLPTNTNEEID